MFWIIVIIILCCLLSSSGVAAYYFMFMNKVVCTDNAFITSMDPILLPGEEKQIGGATNIKCSNNTTLPDSTISSLPASAHNVGPVNRPNGFITSAMLPSMLSNCVGEEKIIGYRKDPINNNFKFVCE